MRLSIVSLSVFVALLSFSSSAQIYMYTMPFEESPHEGTWLQWPHNYTYGGGAEDAEPTWVAMTEALVTGEKVHLIAYNTEEVVHINSALEEAGVAMENVDFFISPNDDYWVRDNGPIFVNNIEGELVILDWGFNGWGGDTPYELCDEIPAFVGEELGLPVVDLNAMVLEGGAFEIDGAGSMMATRSSITGNDRNPGLTEAEIEGYMTQNLGVTNFIWLDGQFGGQEDITDQHIDGFLKFHGDNTIVTMNSSDLNYWYVSASDREIIFNATNASGEPYNYVYLPLTQYPVTTTWGQPVGFRCTYANYYVANTVVLVPNYDDPMDEVANGLIQELYPDRVVVGVNSRNIVLYGGMIHCVTQQQPVPANSIGVDDIPQELPIGELIQVLDLSGRLVGSPEKGIIYLWVYSSGRVVKAISE
jgi:agmatine deiminase|tara:strand:- start:26 stop:1279 length:1254 start_codon:yes stop_codon:yes gene_type:complete